MTEAIVALVVVLLAGCGFLAYRYRSERGIESGISSFRRELRALAPRRDDDTSIPDQSPRILRDPNPPPAEPDEPGTDTDTDTDTGGDAGEPGS